MIVDIAIIGAAVVLAGAALGRHVFRETLGRGSSCADCCERCSMRSDCTLITFKDGIGRGDAANTRPPEPGRTP